jgi:hypothetical protein
MSRREMIDAGKQLLAVKDSEKFRSFTVPGEGQYIGEVSYYVPYKDDLKTLIETEFKK